MRPDTGTATLPFTFVHNVVEPFQQLRQLLNGDRLAMDWEALLPASDTPARKGVR